MITVVGSSLAALISVMFNAEKSAVTWIRANNKVGGHFAGVDIADVPFDIGMVVNEPYTSKGVTICEPELPTRQNGLPYVSMIFDYLSNVGLQFKTIEAFALKNHKLFKDYLIADNLEALLEPPEFQKVLITKQCIEKEMHIGDVHPKFKVSNPLYRDLNFREILQCVSSECFAEEFIYSWLSKMHNGIESIIPGIEHRAIWAPMYYPETIRKVLSNEIPPDLFTREFIVPTNQSLNMIVKDFQKKVTENPRIKVINLEDSSSYDFKDDSSEKYFFGSPAELKTILRSTIDIPSSKRSREISLVFGKFNRFIDFEKVINIVDREYEAYRVTFRSLINDNRENSIFTLEFGENIQDSYNFDSNISKLFTSLDINEEFQILKVIKTSVPIYDVQHCKLRDKLYEDSSTFLTSQGINGSIIDYRSASFNDQVLLGLWHYE